MFATMGTWTATEACEFGVHPGGGSHVMSAPLLIERGGRRGGGGPSPTQSLDFLKRVCLPVVVFCPPRVEREEGGA